MSKEKETIVTINEEIVRSVVKKVITNTSSENTPFDKLIFSMMNAGYGFSIEDGKKFLAVRATDKLMVHISNKTLGYKKNFILSDTKREKITTDSEIEIYKKYGINAAYTLIKKWLELGDNETPDFGKMDQYKY